ncbi:MAG TPA: hypothetical protein VF765_24445 [Polyangiaceae bacterium]
MVLLAIPVQWLVYGVLAHVVFKLTRRRAALLALARVAVGVAIYWPAKLVLPLSFFATHFVSAPIAWAVVAAIDPRRSWPRLLLWVGLGTAVSVVLNYAFFGLGSDDYFKESLNLIPG